MIISAKNANKVKYDSSWNLIWNEYGTYDSYDFYTQDGSYNEAKKVRNKLHTTFVVLGWTFFINLFIALFLVALNYDEKNGLHNHVIFVFICIIASICGLSLLAIGIINGFYEQYDKKYLAYFNSEEYKQDCEEMKRLVKIAIEKEKEEKANDLIIVYEALDDKKLSRQKKIKIIKDKIK